MFNLLGSIGMNNLLGSNSQQNPQNMMNGYSPYQNQQAMLNNQYQWAQMMNSARQEVKWKFNGVDCSVREMADMIWTIDCPEKTHFILKYE